MEFNVPCFVTVKDFKERNELVEWCRNIGYEFIQPPIEEELGDKVVCESSYVGVAHDAETFASAKYVDCGDNVNLFRALAAINDENNLQQWFVIRKHIKNLYGTIVYRKGELYLNQNYKTVSPVYFRKATVEEIVKYYGNK